MAPKKSSLDYLLYTKLGAISYPYKITNSNRQTSGEKQSVITRNIHQNIKGIHCLVYKIDEVWGKTVSGYRQISGKKRRLECCVHKMDKLWKKQSCKNKHQNNKGIHFCV